MLLRHARWTRQLLLAIALASSSEADAQRRVGTVSEVRPAGERNGCRASQQPAAAPTSVVLARGRETTFVKPPLPQPLALDDRFTVGNGSDTRLRIDDAKFGHGVIVLAPQILCRMLAADRTFEPGDSVAGAGSYKLDSLGTAKGARTLRLVIFRGGAFIQWDTAQKVPLQILGGEETLTSKHTEFVVVGDSLSGYGYLYVRSGVVSFDAYPEMSATTGQLYRLRRGLPPQRVPLSTAASDDAELNIDYHARRIWTETRSSPLPPAPARRSTMRSLIRNPLTYVFLGGAGYGVWQLTHSDSPSSDNTSTGQVTINLPL